MGTSTTSWAGRLRTVTFATVVATGPAFAQSLSEGTTVKITALSPQDAFFQQRKAIVGLVCGVEEPGLDPQGNSKKWYGGAVTCGEAGNYYFYKVAVQPGDFGISYEVLTGHAVGEPMPGTSEPADDSSDAAEASALWPTGARVRITDVSAQDAHVGDKATLVGQACTVADAALSGAGESWFSGQLKCDGGWSGYFYQVSVAGLAASAPVVGATAPVAAPVASEWGAGKMVKIVDFAAVDALYATRAALIGKTCSVVEAALSPTGEGFYAGRLFCDDGKSYQTFKVKVVAP
jgi:hypothetical protein